MGDLELYRLTYWKKRVSPLESTSHVLFDYSFCSHCEILVDFGKKVVDTGEQWRVIHMNVCILFKHGKKDWRERGRERQQGRERLFSLTRKKK